ncbi:MAG: hypothetical protein ACFCU4_00690 [Puniceicoccaceae bacterium]
MPALNLKFFFLLTWFCGSALFIAAESSDSDRPAEILFGTTAFHPTRIETFANTFIASWSPIAGSDTTVEEELTQMIVRKGSLGEVLERAKSIFEVFPGAEIHEIPNRREDRAAFFVTLQIPQSQELEYHLYYFNQIDETGVEAREYVRRVPVEKSDLLEGQVARLGPIWLRELASLRFPPEEELGIMAVLPYQAWPYQSPRPSDFISTDGSPRYRQIEVNEEFLSLFGRSDPAPLQFTVALPFYLNPTATGYPKVAALLHFSWDGDGETTPGETVVFNPLSFAHEEPSSPAGLTLLARLIEKDAVTPFLSTKSEGTISNRYRTQIQGQDAIVIEGTYHESPDDVVSQQFSVISIPRETGLNGLTILWIREAIPDLVGQGSSVLSSVTFQ